mmetsp:Transcript_13931/g.44193  ORF Transcript_13931/g.44193 Transcript_13931/m.44193 type:complete len:97 (+) Transcript_13931:566-856(+)
MGDHSEAVQVIFDPNKVSYAALLTKFFNEHDAMRKQNKARPQYASKLMYHDLKQRRQIEAQFAAIEEKKGVPPGTAVQKFDIWYRAEDYHQNYLFR